MLPGSQLQLQPGSLTIDIAVTPSITGQSTTAAIGVIDPKDQVVGLTVQQLHQHKEQQLHQMKMYPLQVNQLLLHLELQ